MNTQTSSFQEVIESVEELPPDDQMLLVDIIRQRLIEVRRRNLVAEVAEARQAYQTGDAYRGSVDDLVKELSR
ncbi:MAG: hypothetical protein H8E28_15290 [Anaerolineae bacterium]|nr:hypothetical protein [Anaerolineae bacterium]